MPPSNTRIALPARTSTQLVLPPTATVSGPGLGMLPRTPQNVIRIVKPRCYPQSAFLGDAVEKKPFSLAPLAPARAFRYEEAC